MRRFVASILLVALAIAPALQFWCESSCAMPAQHVAKHGCHGEPSATGSVLTAAHECNKHAQAPAVAIKPTAIPDLLAAISAPFTFLTVSSRASLSPDFRAPNSVGNSPPGSLAPLRI